MNKVPTKTDQSSSSTPGFYYTISKKLCLRSPKGQEEENKGGSPTTGPGKAKPGDKTKKKKGKNKGDTKVEIKTVLKKLIKITALIPKALQSPYAYEKGKKNCETCNMDKEAYKLVMKSVKVVELIADEVINKEQNEMLNKEDEQDTKNPNKTEDTKGEKKLSIQFEVFCQKNVDHNFKCELLKLQKAIGDTLLQLCYCKAKKPPDDERCQKYDVSMNVLEHLKFEYTNITNSIIPLFKTPSKQKTPPDICVACMKEEIADCTDTLEEILKNGRNLKVTMRNDDMGKGKCCSRNYPHVHALVQDRHVVLKFELPFEVTSPKQEDDQYTEGDGEYRYSTPYDEWPSDFSPEPIEEGPSQKESKEITPAEVMYPKESKLENTASLSNKSVKSLKNVSMDHKSQGKGQPSGVQPFASRSSEKGQPPEPESLAATALEKGISPGTEPLNTTSSKQGQPGSQPVSAPSSEKVQPPETQPSVVSSGKGQPGSQIMSAISSEKGPSRGYQPLPVASLEKGQSGSQAVSEPPSEKVQPESQSLPAASSEKGQPGSQSLSAASSEKELPSEFQHLPETASEKGLPPGPQSSPAAYSEKGQPESQLLSAASSEKGQSGPQSLPATASEKGKPESKLLSAASTEKRQQSGSQILKEESTAPVKSKSQNSIHSLSSINEKSDPHNESKDLNSQKLGAEQKSSINDGSDNSLDKLNADDKEMEDLEESKVTNTSLEKIELKQSLADSSGVSDESMRSMSSSDGSNETFPPGKGRKQVSFPNQGNQQIFYMGTTDTVQVLETQLHSLLNKQPGSQENIPSLFKSKAKHNTGSGHESTISAVDSVILVKNRYSISDKSKTTRESKQSHSSENPISRVLQQGTEHTSLKDTTKEDLECKSARSLNKKQVSEVLKDFSASKLLSVSLPAECFKKNTIVNDFKCITDLPFSASLHSLPLDQDDLLHITQAVEKLASKDDIILIPDCDDEWEIEYTGDTDDGKTNNAEWHKAFTARDTASNICIEIQTDKPITRKRISKSPSYKETKNLPTIDEEEEEKSRKSFQAKVNSDKKFQTNSSKTTELRFFTVEYSNAIGQTENSVKDNGSNKSECEQNILHRQYNKQLDKYFIINPQPSKSKSEEIDTGYASDASSDFCCFPRGSQITESKAVDNEQAEEKLEITNKACHFNSSEEMIMFHAIYLASNVQCNKSVTKLNLTKPIQDNTFKDNEATESSRAGNLKNYVNEHDHDSGGKEDLRSKQNLKLNTQPNSNCRNNESILINSDINVNDHESYCDLSSSNENFVCSNINCFVTSSVCCTCIGRKEEIADILVNKTEIDIDNKESPRDDEREERLVAFNRDEKLANNDQMPTTPLNTSAFKSVFNSELSDRNVDSIISGIKTRDDNKTRKESSIKSKPSMSPQSQTNCKYRPKQKKSANFDKNQDGIHQFSSLNDNIGPFKNKIRLNHCNFKRRVSLERRTPIVSFKEDNCLKSKIQRSNFSWLETKNTQFSESALQFVCNSEISNGNLDITLKSKREYDGKNLEESSLKDGHTVTFPSKSKTNCTHKQKLSVDADNNKDKIQQFSCLGKNSTLLKNKTNFDLRSYLMCNKTLENFKEDKTIKSVIEDSNYSQLKAKRSSAPETKSLITGNKKEQALQQFSNLNSSRIPSLKKISSSRSNLNQRSYFVTKKPIVKFGGDINQFKSKTCQHKQNLTSTNQDIKLKALKLKIRKPELKYPKTINLDIKPKTAVLVKRQTDSDLIKVVNAKEDFEPKISQHETNLTTKKVALQDGIEKNNIDRQVHEDSFIFESRLPTSNFEVSDSLTDSKHTIKENNLFSLHNNMFHLFEANGYPPTDGLGKPLENRAGTSLLKVDKDGLPIDFKNVPVFDSSENSVGGKDVNPVGTPCSDVLKVVLPCGGPMVLCYCEGIPQTSVGGIVLVNSAGEGLLQLDFEGNPVSDHRGQPVFDVNGEQIVLK